MPRIRSLKLTVYCFWSNLGETSFTQKEIRQEHLEKAYQGAKSVGSDTLRLTYLSKIQWSFLGLRDSLWFRQTNKEANRLARQLGDSLRLAGSHWDLGLFLKQNAVKDSAFNNLSKAQKLYDRLGDKKSAGILLFDIAVIQSAVKDYTGSEISLVRAIELLKTAKREWVVIWLLQPTGKSLQKI